MRIQSLELKNIGVFKDNTIAFEPCPVLKKAEIHIFTGTNGSGKSTILKALAGAFETTARNTHEKTVSVINTNNLAQYLRTKDEHSGAKVFFEIQNQIQHIEYSGCPKGANHIHILSEDHEAIRSYRAALQIEYTQDNEDFFYKQSSPKTLHNALFAYSGYRLLNFTERQSGLIVKNPLFQSLEFLKEQNPAFSISNWIKTSLLKRSYAQTEGLTTKEHNYNDTIQKLENAIGEIIGFDVKFKLDKNIRNPIFLYNNIEHGLEVLPDGLKSIISWLADLCMRLEALDWKGDIPVFDRNVILFLDEIEVHLHIEWQRKILPVVQKLLPNAQIFISTHSPFVVNSVDDAWVYNLEVNNGDAVVRKKELSQDGNSIAHVLRSIFGVTEKFGLAVEKDLADFYIFRKKALAKRIEKEEEHEMLELAKKLAVQSIELETTIGMELRQINKQTGKNYEI